MPSADRILPIALRGSSSSCSQILMALHPALLSLAGAARSLSRFPAILGPQ